MLVKIIRWRLGSESYAKCDGNVCVEEPGQQYNSVQMRCDFVVKLKAQAGQFNKCGFIAEHVRIV